MSELPLSADGEMTREAGELRALPPDDPAAHHVRQQEGEEQLMAALPSGDWLIQRIGGEVILFHRHTEEEIVRFDPMVADGIARAQGVIAQDPRLNPEDRSFAHFWSGYFYAHTR